MTHHLTHSAAVAIAEQHAQRGVHVTAYVTADETLLLIDLRSEPMVCDDFAGAVVECAEGYPEPSTSLYGSFQDAQAVYDTAAGDLHDAAIAAFEESN